MNVLLRTCRQPFVTEGYRRFTLSSDNASAMNTDVMNATVVNDVAFMLSTGQM